MDQRQELETSNTEISRKKNMRNTIQGIEGSQ